MTNKSRLGIQHSTALLPGEFAQHLLSPAPDDSLLATTAQQSRPLSIQPILSAMDDHTFP